ncbi:hypothetical protein FA15DRAFT_175169 [Coprinopsis marcescibilis]|uniref:Membrane anchor Opy2 N-terminal domain-containing protein n=1 Tax=Coprinopsis marcescibilis TaxID=230819 RepID=A0A5C3KHE2_COPMA|nr:hypothetical protein FA15DRAFT_175169 [Coprinopsis marcescibilis]
MYAMLLALLSAVTLSVAIPKPNASISTSPSTTTIWPYYPPAQVTLRSCPATPLVPPPSTIITNYLVAATDPSVPILKGSPTLTQPPTIDPTPISPNEDESTWHSLCPHTCDAPAASVSYEATVLKPGPDGPRTVCSQCYCICPIFDCWCRPPLIYAPKIYGGCMGCTCLTPRGELPTKPTMSELPPTVITSVAGTPSPPTPSPSVKPVPNAAVQVDYKEATEIIVSRFIEPHAYLNDSIVGPTGVPAS